MVRANMDSENTVSAVGNRLRLLFQERRWAELRQLVALENIWYLHSPLTADEAVALAERSFASASELELELVRIVRSELENGVAKGTYTCRLGWWEEKKLKQSELDFDVHIGFHVEGAVRVAYLGVTRADPFWPSKRPEATVAGENGQVTVYVPVLVPAGAAQSWLRGAPQE